MNYRQFADYVQQHQRLTQRSMRGPDDDWYPHAYFLAADRVVVKPIPTPFFDGVEAKQLLVHNVLVPLIEIGRPRAFAMSVVMFLLSAEHPMGKVIAERMLEGGDESPTAGLPRFQDVDGSIEQLQVHVFDAERHEMWAANIERPDDGPPSIPPFELLGADIFFGDLVDPIKAALR